MENRNVPFGLAIGAIVLVTGIAGLGIYRQSIPATNGNPVSVVQSQDGQDIPGVGVAVSGSNLEPLSAEKVAIPSVCPELRADGTTASCYDFVQETIINNPFDTFDEYAKYTKRTMIPDLIRANYSDSLVGQELKKKIEEELGRYSGDYEFWEEMVDGHPALFHRRNFYGFIGNIYEMHIDTGNGNITILSSEIDNNILDTIYHSYTVRESFTDWRTYKGTYRSAGTFSFRYPSRVCDSETGDCRRLRITETDSVITLNDPGRGHFAIYYGADIADEGSANGFLQATLKNNLCKIDPSNTYVLEGTTIKNVFLDEGCSLYGPEYEKYAAAHPEAIGLSGKVRVYWAMDSKELVVFELARGGGCAFTVCGIEGEVSKSMELSGINLFE